MHVYLTKCYLTLSQVKARQHLEQIYQGIIVKLEPEHKGHTHQPCYIFNRTFVKKEDRKSDWFFDNHQQLAKLTEVTQTTTMSGT